MLMMLLRPGSGQLIFLGALMMRSLSYEEIARELGCSERNVRFHLNNVLEKTGYKNKMQLLLAISDKRLIIPKPVRELRD